MKVVMEVPLTLDPGRVQYNSSRRMNEADERHTPRQSTYPAASLRLGIAWITHTPRGVHRLHQTLVGLERLMTWGPVLASLCVNALLRLFLSSEAWSRRGAPCPASRFAWDAACWGVD